MEQKLIDQLGDELYAALSAANTVAPLTDRHATITNEEAYQIQRRLIDRRLAGGEQIIGKKIGVTSDVVQKMLNVDQPDFGFLMNTMRFASGADISIGKLRLIQPRAEGEIAFVLGSDLAGANVTRQDVMDATAYVLPCFEIVDSRIRDWKIRIQDTIADNASCGVFVLGELHTDPKSLDLAAVKLEMQKNGVPSGAGLGSAVQGHPAEAVAWLANMLGRFGVPFRKGEVILSGALAPLVPAAAGDHFELTVTGMGSASVRFSA
jgi:2-oxopent-4-enoate/cis-2-oxohex-4-enoate hydratase